jgi:type IV secretory pathway VirB10-like protein
VIRGFLSRRRDPAPAEDTTTSLRPQPPLAKRLNRNALTVAAVIMGMTVLTAIVILSPGRNPEKSNAPAAIAEETPVPPRPSFLDEPVRQSSTEDTSQRAVDGRTAGTSQVIAPSVSSAAMMPSRTSSFETPPLDPATDDGVRSHPAEDSPRDRAFQSALSSSVVVSGGDGRTSAGAASSPASLASEEEQMVTLGDSILRSAIRPGVGATGVVGAPGANPPASSEGVSTREATRSFVDRAVADASPGTLAQVEAAESRYTLNAGTVIPGLLITGINSELPGQIVGQVSRPVYDSRTQREVLITQGSRLIGTYDNQIATGQGRLLVAWTRVIFPDGRSIRLPGLPLTDNAGQSGAKDKVDNHWRRVFGNALLLSAISAGVQLSQPSQSSVLAAPSPGQVAAGAVGQELSNVALEILRRGMDVAPTITIRAGQPFNVFLSGDLVFDGPYLAAR